MMLLDVPAPAGVADHTDDQTLTARVCALAANERAARADFIVHLAEFHRRRLHLALGYSSLFTWLTEKLGMSKASAYRRATAAQLQARMPAVASYLREGRLTLTKLCLLKDVLEPDSYLACLEKAAAMTEKEVEELALVLDPGRAKPAPRDSIRPLPPPRAAAAAPAASGPQGDLFAAPAGLGSAAEPTAPLRQLITMSVGAEFLTQLDEVRAALSHSHPGASLETLFSECMKAALAAHRCRTEAETDRPRPTSGARRRKLLSRYITAEVRRIVFCRDQRRCTFISEDGHRCTATHRLEIHHDDPYWRGGPPTVENLRLACKQHNGFMARQELGDRFMDQALCDRETAKRSAVPSRATAGATG